MATLPPNIQTYHCLCSSLLLASTHKLSNLPRRQGSALDEALILPLPPAPLWRRLSESADPELEEDSKDMPAEGYTILLGLVQDKKVTVIRREDGFEKRLASRCVRCNLLVAYEILQEGGAMEVDSGKGKAAEHFTGKILYLLPGGLMSSEVMMGDKKIGEDDVVTPRTKVAVFE